jgi:hypothetical protein
MSSEFQKQVDPVITSFPMRLVVAVVVVIIILMFVAKLFNMGAERFTGSGVQDRVFTSGATMRVLSQSLSATNQEDRQTISNSEIKEAIPGILKGDGGERLVGDRADPNFFEIGDELAAYQSTAFNTPDTDSAGNSSSANTSGSAERLTNSPVATVEDIQLAQMLGTYPRGAGAYS